MRLIYTKDGFSENEKEEWRIIIFNNILDSLRLVIDAMEEFGIVFEYDNSTVCIFSVCENVYILTINLIGSPPYYYARQKSTGFRADPN